MAVSLEKKTIISQDGRKSTSAVTQMRTTWEDHWGHQGRVFSQTPLNQKLGNIIVSPVSVALDEPCKILETSLAYLQNENHLQGAVLPLNV